MKCYVDSSVILRFLLLRDPSFTETAQFEKLGSSELLVIECNRVIQRYHFENLINDEQLGEVKQHLDEIVDGISLIELTKTIKNRAASFFPTVIGTLDAIHLSSALLWKEYDDDEGLVLFTFDNQMITCARALSLELIKLNN